jgi:dihydropteroate synthase
MLMGILNVTPDSFSDGGKWLNPQAAMAQALQMIDDGAEIIDIGGESTRPYSLPVSAEEQIARVVPVIAELATRTSIPISIDTSLAEVAAAAIDAGAEIVNDVTGLEGDPDMLALVAQSGVGVCAMHMQGTPLTMQDQPSYRNCVEEILVYLRQRYQAILDSGVAPDRICLDPGIGFGKTHQHNLELLREARRFLELPTPILIGHSRKGFIGNVLEDKERQRDAGTLGVSLHLAQCGIHILRVHEIRNTRDAIRLFQAVQPLPQLSTPQGP